ncbi:MAG: MoaD/ThiS family protein [Gallionella sp.]|jgi:molybdopterin converting factor small subunit
MKKPFAQLFLAFLKRKHAVSIMYFGRTSEFLMMTSERMVIPNGIYTLEQLLDRLRIRGGRWACELDDSHVICTVNGKAAALSDTIEAGGEIGIFSSKSVFER